MVLGSSQGSYICGPNEVYKSCGTACPATCSRTPEVCIEVCREGCFCKDGYVRSDDTGLCIPRSACPRTSYY
ncbi:hypothetical protein GWI33_005900 [Rhynchophorus ferrugineus]|uniref:TIL domain-containing protein n=1 Tax=Rhynchophorus ferrugineus TaxID=354439 RepID=A0A834MNH3_RHYFE|nr:hypothetical protein GWI33_005900 [Rhynchophorus ferrugineus]